VPRPFEVSRGVVEDKEMIVVGVVFLKDIHRHSGLRKYVTVRKIAVALCARADNDTSGLLPVR